MLRALELSGSPLVVGSNVLVIGRSYKPQGQDCYVLAFDLSNGQYRWGRYIAGIGAYSTGDKTSHLAYDHGRVYVLTNLGAAAALDANSGTIAWLDVYPTGKPADNLGLRAGINPMFLNGGLANTVRFKPWMFNSVIVHDGKLFVLPTEGENLLIYDAASGREEKRINLEQLAHWDFKGGEQPDKPTTLIGVLREQLVMAGDSRVLCLDWQKYDEASFPGPNDEMILWPSIAPSGIRGRCFMTTDSVFVPGADRLRRIDMKNGAAVEEYPLYPRGWEDGEAPGNVLVSGNRLVIAGASNVDIYADPATVFADIDREIAAAPDSPGPRLRYAEIMNVCGRDDEALSRLNEALKLMGGEAALAPAGPGPGRGRLFNDALAFVSKSAGDDRPATRERVAKLFDLAARAAYTPQQQVNYRLARCLRDLYKSYEFEEKVVAGPPGQAVYLGASKPGQLVISDRLILAVTDNVPGAPLWNQKWVSLHSLETGEPVPLRYDAGGGRGMVDRMMTADTNDWKLLLRIVAPHVYVVGPSSVFAYNLDKPGETWHGSSPAVNDGPPADIQFREVFCGQQHMVVLDQPASAPVVANGDPTQVRLLAFGRRLARENDPDSGESGRLDFPVTLTDPAGIQVASWQACDGGFYYATDDGKVHMLRGAKEAK